MLLSPRQRLTPHNSLRTQDNLRLTPIQWNPLSILAHRTRRPNITTTVTSNTLISIPHDLDRLNGIPIPTIPQRIARGIALVHLLTVPHLDKTVGVYIVGVFRLDRDPSLFSWERKVLSLSNANEL